MWVFFLLLFRKGTHFLFLYFFEKIQKIQDFADIFKGCSLKQVLKQAELDVIEINGDTAYLVEVAFHENGLQYGNATKTKKRILKKLVRAYLIGLIFFPGKDYEIIFASPKVDSTRESLMQEAIPVLEKQKEKRSFTGYFENWRKYNLSPEEISFIESKIKAME